MWWRSGTVRDCHLVFAPWWSERSDAVREEDSMANVALELELELDREQRESTAVRWSRDHASAVRGLLSLLIVGIVWEIAGRTGRWPLVLAPISEIWVKFLQLAASGELT